MTVSVIKSAFVDQTSTTIDLSSIFTDTAASSNPAYLVLNALDRNEYTAGASGATGSFSGNGHTLNLGGIGSYGRGAGIVFTYQASTGRYYNSTYGYLDQVTYTSSSSLDDVTNLSLFGTNSLSVATSYASNAYALMDQDSGGYIGSATIATEPSFSGTVPSQATPDSIAAVAETFVGKAWNMDGCWVLASTIAAEAGASLPVQSTSIGTPGQANGEWIVAFNGPAGQSGNWQSMVTAGEIIVIETSGGGGHITTCVSGSGSSAKLIDNITYESGNGQIENSANDGSSNDIIVSAAHIASQEWSGVQASSVVIYELDTPIVSDLVTSDSLATTGRQSLAGLFTAADPASKAITEWQVYDSASTDSFVVNSATSTAHSASSALTVSSLSAVSLLAGSVATTDVLDVRAFNGSYWGDWQSLSVAVSASAVTTPTTTPTVSAPVVAVQTANQTWLGGHTLSLALPAGTFHDPQNQALTYSASLSSGLALPSWLTFNKATDTFSGTAPASAQTLTIAVKATDTSGLSVTDTFSATVIGAPVVATATAKQSWLAGQAVSFALPAGTFRDPQSQALTYSATLSSGQALPSWLSFNAATETFSGTAPASAQTLSIAVKATDTSGLSVTDTFAAAVIGAPVLVIHTANQAWAEGHAISLELPAGTFQDPQNQALTYSASLSSGQALPSWLSFNATTRTFTGTAPAVAQTLSISVKATDASGLSVWDTFSAAIIGAPVVATQTSSQTWLGGRAFTLALPAGTFKDPQNQTLTYSASLASGQALPSWLIFNKTTGTFTGTAPASAQTLSIAVKATDTSGLSVTETFSATVIGTPVLTKQTANQTWAEGQAITLSLPAGTFHDPQNQALTYSASLSSGQALPSWLTFNAATDTFSGTAPALAQTLTIAVKATDTSGLSVTDTFTAAVAGTPVVAQQTANQSWTEGHAIALTLPAQTFTDPQSQALTYTATQANGSALPSWLKFHAATDSFTGTAPSTAQTLGIKVTATDTSGLAVSETFNATVAPATATAITLMNPTPDPVWNGQQTLDFVLPSSTFSASLSGPMQFAAYQISGANTPDLSSWLHFNAATDAFSGLVPAGETGTVGIAVIATDAGHLTAGEMFNVTFANGSGEVSSGAQGVSGILADMLRQSPALIALHA